MLGIAIAASKIDEWRCTRSATFVYAPGRNWFSGTLLAEPPEQLVDGEIERVEIDQRTGEAVIWTRDAVYVLQPGELAVDREPTCVTQLRRWQIVGVHRLGSVDSRDQR